MTELETYLANGTLYESAGAITPLLAFTRSFLRWLDDPVKQMYWGQNRRVEKELRKLGFDIGPVFCTADGPINSDVWIANLSGHEFSRSYSSRKIVREPFLPWIVPVDLTESEQLSIQRTSKIAAA